MVENDLNEGEYAIFSTTSNQTDNNFASTTKLGTIDFGASVNLNAAGTTEFLAFKYALDHGMLETGYVQSVVDAIEAGNTPVVAPPPVAAAYTITAAATSADEGTSATFNVTSTNTVAGNSVTYTISGVSAADVTGALSGTATVDANGAASISVALANDLTTEGAETLTVTLSNGLTANTTVNDTSIATIYDSTQTVADSQTYDATTGNVLFTVPMSTGSAEFATLAGFAAGDVMDIADEYLLPSSMMIAITGTTEINFGYGDLTDFAPAWVVTLSNQDVTLVGNVGSAANATDALALLNTAYGDGWLM